MLVQASVASRLLGRDAELDPCAAGSSVTGRASTSSAAKHRYDATIDKVEHFNQPPDKRQDMDYVVVRLDFALGACWWVVDEGTVSIGERYTITVEGPRVA